jgi:hypothetical protein
MHHYSEDNFGARALNWIMIGGAAVLFALVTFASFSPQALNPAPETVVSTVTHSTHA